MSNCFEILARSSIVSAKREGREQRGPEYVSPFHSVNLDPLSGVSIPCDAGYELDPFQFASTGDSLNGRRGFNQHHQHYYSTQVIQGGAFVSASGMMKEPLGVSTDSSLMFNAWSSSDGGSSLSENTSTNQLRALEEQWWVDVLAPGSMVKAPTLFQQENIGLNARAELGIRRQHFENLRSMPLAQPADPTVMTWVLGDGQTHGQDEIQPADNLMLEQLGHHLGDDLLRRHVLRELNCRDIFSPRPCSSVSYSPASSEPNSDPESLYSHTSLPRALPLPFLLNDISLNPANLTRASTFATPASTFATPVPNMDEPGTHSFSAPTSFVGATLISPDAFPTAEHYAQYLLFGNSISEGQFSHKVTDAVQSNSLAMEEGPAIMRGSLSTSPSSGHSLHPKSPTFTPPLNFQDTDKLVEQWSILQPSFPSVARAEFPARQIMSPPAIPGDCAISQQLPWNPANVPLQLHQTCCENGCPKVTCGRKQGTLKNRIHGALSPLTSVPGFNLRSRKLTGGSSNLAGDDRKHEDAKLDTGQMKRGVIPEGGLAIVHLLLRAAEAVDIGNVEMAKAILARLNQHISPTREKSIHRVAIYFREALFTRISGVENFATQLSQDRTLSSLEEFHKINAYVRFCEVSPYPKFAHFTANQVILEVLEGEEAMHVIDFQIGAGAQWASFIQDIASLRAARKLVPTIRLTAVGTRADAIHATGANLCNFARMLDISLEFQAVVTRPECLDVSMLGLRDNEAVAGNFIFTLHELLDGDTSEGLSAVLKSLLDARPRVVTTVEQEANRSSTPFQQRFSEALQYYVFLFDSLTSSLEAGADSSANSSIESYLLAPEIMNLVSCDSVSRVERHERFEQWRDRMLAAGFSPRPLSDVSQFQAEKLVAQISARRGFQVTRDQRGLLLGWQGRPLLVASSWIC